MDKISLMYHLSNIEYSACKLREEYGIEGDFVIKNGERCRLQIQDFLEDLASDD